jgi:hypothetical protein
MKAAILFTITVFLSHSSNLLAKDRWWDVIPAQDSMFGGGFVDQEDGAIDPEMAEALKQKTFSEWVQYEDEFVSFEYPKHPLIQFELKKPGQAIKVEGGVCSMVDNSFTQAYQLKVGKTSYALILLNPAKWLDDGVCMCGPMVYHAYQLEQGTVKRFSMLPGGAVKKAQVVGGGLRFMAFEWTHLACPREVYERVVSSMKIKTSEPGGNEALKKKLLAHYGADAKIGLIPKGSPVQDLIDAFGAPNHKSDQGIWSWQWISTNYPMMLEAQIADGKLIQLPSCGIERDTDNPVRGSLAWCAHQLELVNDRDDDDSISMPQEDQDLIATIITRSLKKHAEKRGYYWQATVNMANSAYQNQIQRKEWAQIIMKHGTAAWFELDYLHDTKTKDLDVWIEQQLQRLIGAKQAAPYQVGIDGGTNIDGIVNLLQEINDVSYGKIAPKLWASGQPALMASVFQGVIAGSESLTEAQVEKWVLEALQQKDLSSMKILIYQAMDIIPQLDFTDPSPYLKLVKRLPEGKKKSDWSQVRSAAIQHLTLDQ